MDYSVKILGQRGLSDDQLLWFGLFLSNQATNAVIRVGTRMWP